MIVMISRATHADINRRLADFLCSLFLLSINRLFGADNSRASVQQLENVGSSFNYGISGVYKLQAIGKEELRKKAGTKNKYIVFKVLSL